MKFISDKKNLIFILFIIIFLLNYPDQIFPKTIKKPRPTKPKQNSQTLKKTEHLNPDVSFSTASALNVDARSAVLMDALTGEILFQQNQDLRIPPASFAKILTLYIVFDGLRSGQIKKDELVTVSEKAWRTQGSKMFIKVGERVKVEDLMKGVAIVSGNDACVALAEYIAGSEEIFVSKMNEKARLLGMKNSNFKNSHGMPDENQYTTAMDMAILSKQYIEDHPEALSLHSTTEFEYNGIRQGNRNTLLQKNIGVDGLKTGHIEESGYHLVATAKRDGQRMIAVVMGCDKVKKRAPEAQKLLEYGFKNFSTIKVIKKNAPFGPIKVKWGKSDQLFLNPSEEVMVTIPKGKENLVFLIPQIPESVVAPIKKGQVIGKVIVQKEGKSIKEIGLLASSDIKKSFIPPWPISLGIIFGILLLGAIVILLLHGYKRH